MKAIRVYFFTSLSHATRIIVLLLLTRLSAQVLGPNGFGELGHFMTVSSAMYALAGGGILNGIVNYISKHKNNENSVAAFMGAGFSYSLVFSCLVAIVYFGSKNYLLSKYFVHTDYDIALFVLVVFQFFYALTNLFIGYINGIADTSSYSKVIIIGHIIALPICYFSIEKYNFLGAAIALLLPNFMTFIPALFYIVKRHSWDFFKIKFDFQNFNYLFKFSGMALISTTLFPLAEISVRQLIIQHIGIQEAGFFQGLWRISLVYISFISTFLVFYFLPQVSALRESGGLKPFFKKTLFFVWGIFASGVLIFLLTKNQVIKLVLSEDFLPVAEYVKYQVIGDFFKITGYVFIFLIISESNLKKYALVEFVHALAFFAFSSILVNYNPQLISIYQAHMLTTVVYLILVASLATRSTCSSVKIKSSSLQK